MTRPAFLDRNFLALWIGQAVSLLGDRLDYLALVALVGAAPGGLGARGAAMHLSWIAVCTTAPVLLFAGLAGALVDRWPRKRVLVVCDALRASGVLLIPFSQAMGGGLPAALAIVVVLSTINVFFLPARAAILPEIVAPEHLMAANACTTGGAIAATLTGAVVGGALIQRYGFATGFYLDSLSYTLSVVAMSSITVRAVTAPRAADGARQVWRDPSALVRGLGEGFAAIRRTPGVAPAVAMFVALYAIGASLFVLAPLAVASLSRMPTRDTGVLMGLLAGGVIVSAGALMRWGGARSPWRLAGAGGVVLGAALIGFAMAHSFRLLGVLACVAGMGAAPLLIGADALVQGAIDPSVRARVFATRDVLSKATFLLCALAVGAWAPRVGTGAWLAGEGIVVAIAGLWLARSAYASRAVAS